MSSSENERNDLDAFVSKAWQDLDAGGLRSLEEYQREFPGDPEGLAQEYRALVRDLAADRTQNLAGRDDPVTGPGAMLGAFRIVQELGSGGQGTVYLADDVRLGRRVALKVLTRSAADPAVSSRFQREARITSRLDHPGLCTVYETGEFRGTPWIAMRYVEGESLARRIAVQRGEAASWATVIDNEIPPSPAEDTAPPPPTPTGAEIGTWVGIIERAALALHAAHEAGVVHRDLKPGNLMVTPDNEPVILDFGLARDDEIEATALTQTGQAFGTPLYMSPEQTRGEPLEPRTDIWSLGATLYECLTLQPPFTAPTRAGLYQAIQNEEPVPLRRANPATDRDLETIVATALDKDPARRYQTAWDFAEDLRRHQAREPIRARPAGALLRLRRLVQRNPVPAAIAAVLILSLSVGLLISTQLLAQRDDALHRANRLISERDTALGSARRNLAERDVALRERNAALEEQKRATQRAELEEAKSARAAAKASYEAARQAAGRGKWDAVLQNLEEAGRRGYPDEVAISLLRIEALDARFLVDAALAELELLEQRKDLGDHRGVVLFLRGELGVDRWADPEGGVSEFGAALRLPLPEATRAYIEAMLAPTAAEAIAHARRSLEFDPANRLASELLGSLLVVTGRLDEALAEVTRTRALVPDAPGPLLIEASCYALRGDEEQANRLVQEAARRLPEEQARLVPLGTQIFSAVYEALARGGQGPGKTTQDLMKIARLSQRMIRQKPSAKTRLPVRVPPVFVRHVKEIQRTGPSPYSLRSLLNLMRGRPNPALIAAAEGLATYLDEGTTTFALAIFALGERQGRTDDDLSELFSKAADMPSVLPIRRMALIQSLRLQINAAVASKIPQGTPELEPRCERIRETFSKLQAMGPPTRHELRIILQAVGLCWNDATFMPMAQAWSRQHPDSGTGWFITGYSAMRLGAYGLAVEAFDECLARDPKNRLAPEYRAVCWQKLGLIGAGDGAQSKADYEKARQAAKRSRTEGDSDK